MAILVWIPRIFLLGAFFAAIACLGRADYNLPVFLFAYIAWMYMKVFQKESKNEYVIWYIVIAWKTWFDEDYERLVPWEHTLHVMTLVLVSINFLLKIISVALSFLYESNVKQSFEQSYKGAMKNFNKGKDFQINLN